jgi:CheY-like chemotaxis protein
VAAPEEALDLLRRQPDGFDLLVTDFTMPKMTGLQLARAAHDAAAAVPIVLLTGFIEELPEAALAEAGIRRVLRKPQTLAELADALRGVLDAAPPSAPPAA